jgi:hypothetical protein
VPRPRCLRAAQRSCYLARHTNIALSKSAPPLLRPLHLSACALLRRPSHHSHKPPGRQIAIDGDPHVAHRGFLPWRLSDAGPRARCYIAVGRHPKPCTKAAVARCGERVSLAPESRPTASSIDYLFSATSEHKRAGRRTRVHEKRERGNVAGSLFPCRALASGTHNLSQCDLVSPVHMWVRVAVVGRSLSSRL